MISTSNPFPDIPENVSFAPALRELSAVYEAIEAAQAPWIAATPFRCPPGCGTCCRSFEPEILDVEALYLAAYLIGERGNRLESLDFSGNGPGCVLADPEGEYHCTVYPGRPLVCRLFAFAGDRDKSGALRFSPCKYAAGPARKQWAEAEMRLSFGVLPPAMGDLAGQAESLLPGTSDQRLPLREALPKALAKLRYLRDLAAFAAPADQGGGDGDNDGDNDGGAPPLPRAS